MSNWFIDNDDDDTVTESEQQMRDREIRVRLAKARKAETIEAMKERYRQYESR
jgi:hypothetical protein